MKSTRGWPQDPECLFGAPLPDSYRRLLELATRIQPKEPESALGALALYLTFPQPGRFLRDDGSYADTPSELFVFASTRVDGGHYGFLVDDVPARPKELPIVRVWPNDGVQLIALTFREFVGVVIREADDLPWDPSNRGAGGLVDLLRREFRAPRVDDLLKFGESVLARRLRAPTIPTLDELGIRLPSKSVDRRFLESVRWPASAEMGIPGSMPADIQLLDEAERRLKSGQPGTALVIARNVRWASWYSDWRTDRSVIQRTASILVPAYQTLGRHHAASKVRWLTDWAVREVR